MLLKNLTEMFANSVQTDLSIAVSQHILTLKRVKTVIVIQFHQFQQNEQPPLISTEFAEHKRPCVTLEVQVLAWDRNS